VNNTVLSGIIVGTVVLAAAGAVMVNSGYNPLQKYATVVSVEPAFDTVRTPRPVCGDAATLAQAQAQARAGATAAPGVPAAPAADASSPIFASACRTKSSHRRRSSSSTSRHVRCHRSAGVPGRHGSEHTST